VKEKRPQPTWLEIIKPPKVIIILGYVGKGKSANAYYLAELAIKEYNLHGIVVNLPLDKADLLPPASFQVKSLEEVEQCEDSVIIIDEGTTKLPAGNKLEELVKGFSSLCRQRNQLIILIFHSSRDVGSRILRGVGPILIKEPSRRQIQYGSKDSVMKALLETAKRQFQKIKKNGGDVREYVFVDCEEPDFQGIMENALPSFWSEELSKAWRGTNSQASNFEYTPGLVATDGQTEVTADMQRRAKTVQTIAPNIKMMGDTETGKTWLLYV
jgi:hypothetical protein